MEKLIIMSLYLSSYTSIVFGIFFIPLFFLLSLLCSNNNELLFSLFSGLFDSFSVYCNVAIFVLPNEFYQSIKERQDETAERVDGI